jgi:geranylgeranyl diphosphate synthase type II
MDNDILRRWEPTVWKKFWEANAVLVWDLLNSLSFELISKIKNCTLIEYFWQSVWIKWMVWWQVLDIYYENNPEKLILDNLIETHNRKTWELIKMSVSGWIIISELESQFVKNQETNNIKKYLDFWEKIGLAFQVKDDLLDVEGTCEETGKSVGWENKWFVYFMWIEKTHKYLDNLINDCKKIINPLKSEKLNFLVNYIWSRKK